MEPDKPDLKKRIEEVLDGIVETLKSEGRYTPLLGLQAEHTATLVVMVEQMRNDILSGDVSYVETTKSREGAIRYKQNPIYLLFAQYMDRLQDSLKALGMNVDSRPVKKQERGISEFIEKFQDD